MPGIS
jgi:hypothetical protein